MDTRLQSLLQQAASLGIRVTRCPLPHGRRGEYRHTSRHIFLSSQLSEVQTVAALQHELIHAERGDDGIQTRRVERKVEEETALRLIRPGEYVIAEGMHGGNVGAIAIELDVTPSVVVAYRRVLERERYR